MFRQREDGSEVEKDFIKRHMQQLVQALKRVLHLAQTEQQSEQADEALRGFIKRPIGGLVRVNRTFASTQRSAPGLVLAR